MNNWNKVGTNSNFLRNRISLLFNWSVFAENVLSCWAGRLDSLYCWVYFPATIPDCRAKGGITRGAMAILFRIFFVLKWDRKKKAFVWLICILFLSKILYPLPTNYNALFKLPGKKFSRKTKLILLICRIKNPSEIKLTESFICEVHPAAKIVIPSPFFFFSFFFSFFK